MSIASVSALMETTRDNCSIRRFQARADPRGSLVALEAGREVPFEIHGIYHLYGKLLGGRVFPAHRNLERLVVCLSGAVSIIVDDGAEQREVRLDRPDLGLHIKPMTWSEIRVFSQDAALMFLTSAANGEEGCMRSYSEFVAAVQARLDT